MKLLKPLLFATALFQQLYGLDLPDRVGDLKVYLKHPVIEDKSLSTEQGGVVIGEDFRIQAKNIAFHEDPQSKHKKLQADGGLVIVYRGRIFLGDRFHYNITSKKGFVENGITYDNLWYIGGKRIEFSPDHKIVVQSAFMTTSDRLSKDFDIYSSSLELQNRYLVTAKGAQFRVAKIPLFYLPILKANLKRSTESPIKVRTTLDRGQGIKLTSRYRIYSWEKSAVFLRLDARTSRGFGGAIETTYHSSDMLTHLKTKSYVAHDTFFNDNDPNRKLTRYRLQGVFSARKPNSRWQIDAQYDRISDPNMPLDFKSDDFELNTALATQVAFHRIDPFGTTQVYAHPNINPRFQGFKQELPTITMNFKPVSIGRSRIVSHTALKTSFLDYDYPNELRQELDRFHSFRFELDQSVKRPLEIGNLAEFIPKADYKGVFYSDSPNKKTQIHHIFRYSLKARTRFKKTSKKFVHTVSPYAENLSINPLTDSNTYIFSSDDAFKELKWLKVGVQNAIYSTKRSSKPIYSMDVFAYRFFGSRSLNEDFSKLFVKSQLNFPVIAFDSTLIYNFEQSVFNQTNFGVRWTVNDNVALACQFKHRSKFSPRKEVLENFIFDASTPIDEILNTPISDARNLLVTKLEANLPPKWTFRMASHHGWRPAPQSSYHEFKLDLLHMIASNWRLGLSYIRSVNNEKLRIGLSLVPNQ